MYGCAVQLDWLNAEANLREEVLAQCAQLTPELAFKWLAVEPRRGELDFAPADALADLAAKHGKTLRGHTLIWHRGTPAWAEASLRADKDWTLLERWLASIMPRYAASVSEWDVVNEPIETGHRQDGLRQSVFLEAFGPDYLRRALEAAHALAPRARLMINEYDLEYPLQEQRDRRYCLLKLAERLKAQGAPLHGVGLQAHLDLRKGHIDAAAVTRFCRELAGMGLVLRVTELDVKERDYAAPAAERDRRVADETRRYLDAVLAEPAVLGVSTWGLSDRHSWLTVGADDYARFPGAWTHDDGPGLNRGLPWDAALRPKPMRDAIRSALGAAQAQKS